VGYYGDGTHREILLETGQEFDADAEIVLARPELFTSPGAPVPTPQNTRKGAKR
jgi:hypothetical protein